MKISENSKRLLGDRDSTMKQRKVFGLVKQGARNKRIASVLHMSEHTVKWPKYLVLSALRVERRQDL